MAQSTGSGPCRTGKTAEGALIDCLSCQVRKAAAWEGVKKETVAAVASARKVRTFPALQDIFRQGDPNSGVYCLVGGMVALSLMDARGDVICVHMVREGEVFGHRSLLADEPHCVTAHAVTEAVVCHLSNAKTEALLAGHPDLLWLFTRRMAQNVRQAQEAFLRHGTMTVRQKLIYFLLALGERQGELGGGARASISLPFRRSAVASLIGVVPETLSRLTRRLQDEGVARFASDAVEVFDVPAIRAEVADWRSDRAS